MNVTYVISSKTYWNYIDKGLTHEEIIKYLNSSLGLRGKITELHISKGE